MEHGPNHVLVVEDDQHLRELLVRALQGYVARVSEAEDGRSALQVPGLHSVQAVVLDIGLPDTDGRDVCRALCEGGLQAPVLFLSALGEPEELLSGFEAGGDDYLVKPFEFSELLARLVALTRRVKLTAEHAPQETRLDASASALVSAAGSESLTPLEYQLLAALMGSAGKVMFRDQLMEIMWPDRSRLNPTSLEQYVARVRKKLDLVGSKSSIVTVRGRGYRFQYPD